MTLIALIRHGATSWNAEGRIQGRADTPLSPEGRAELRGLAPPPELDGGIWLSSPLARARETARLLHGEAKVDHGLLETDWGAWEGLTREATTALSHRISSRGAAGLDFRPPDGESPRQVQQRLQQFFAGATVSGHRLAIGVTHKGVIRAALSLAIGWDMLEKPPIKLKWRAAHLFRAHPGGTLTLETPNLMLRPRA